MLAVRGCRSPRRVLLQNVSVCYVEGIGLLTANIAVELRIPRLLV